MTNSATDLQVPGGFQLAGVYCGIKSNPGNPDLTLVVCDRAATAAGVYTQNRVYAAPVALDRQRTPNARTRAVVINSGNANACTGQQGLDDAAEMCRLVASANQVEADDVLVMSTGIIGELLPMEKVAAGIRAASSQLGDGYNSLVAAARGMMTTDTAHKLAVRTLHLDATPVRITGMAKGAAMIGPNMATMLGLILTDAALDPGVAQQMLSAVVDDTFNCIHVDGHMSTNDTVLLVANGAASDIELSAPARKQFREGLHDVCAELARSIPADGEGATHLITIDVSGCADVAAARTIARTVADSPLVKTAVAGADPNWGRVVSAAGYAGVAFDPRKVGLKINGSVLYRDGAPVAFDATEVSASIRDNRDTSIQLEFGEGDAGTRYWTTDLTVEYVRLNADYHT